MTTLLPITAAPSFAPSEDTDSVPPLVSYAYSYPHKSSYRPFIPAVPLADAWRDEDRCRLALYVHIPFCEMRCGFCNLFTQSQPATNQVTDYLKTLARQMRVVRRQIPDARFATFAMGGGTPTFLTAWQLEELLQTLESTLGLVFRDVPTSIETSPATASRERLSVLADRGVERVSLGVQSFVDSDTQTFGRPQRADDVRNALETIRSLDFPVLNIDLIYGDPAQSRDSWLRSLAAALQYRPEELYLYPLYVRPETGLARTGHRAAKHRIDLYRAGRDWLLERGYEQVSLRCFRSRRLGLRPDRPERFNNASPVGTESQPTFGATSYACQQDGMIGLGCGARSYTRDLHYATRFAVTQAGVRAILGEWIAQSDADLALATHGIRLSIDEQRRRFVILSLLQSSGLSLAEYAARFSGVPSDDIPELADLLSRVWLCEQQGRHLLTEAGLENSDIVGPMLYSESVRRRLREFVRL